MLCCMSEVHQDEVSHALVLLGWGRQVETRIIMIIIIQ